MRALENSLASTTNEKAMVDNRAGSLVRDSRRNSYLPALHVNTSPDCVNTGGEIDTRKLGGGGADKVRPVTDEVPLECPFLEVVTVTVASVP